MAVKKTQGDGNRLKTQDKLFGRQRSYQAVFNKEASEVQAVLKDLAKFCRANESTFDLDPRVHAALEGRREVWLRITSHLDLDSKDIWEMYTGTKFS